MWLGSPEPFIDRYNISRAQALQLQCTAEHLCARSDGGTDSQQNIVAACCFCNSGRHAKKVARDPDEHKRHIQRSMARGKWHGSWVFDNPALAIVCRH
ncbi:HNH endonuclease [Paraburkholderia tropica]|uniref:HNH endonuclease n=1 Tax=Paraburkholderia tropica TaxID=92647 RepID=UPI0021A42CAD|nr:HNH endonuclease [Paraburkholderia tropica]